METRDKLFTEEQYLKQLKLYNEEILYYEQKHLSGKHIGYDSLFNYRLRSLLAAAYPAVHRPRSDRFSPCCHRR